MEGFWVVLIVVGFLLGMAGLACLLVTRHIAKSLLRREDHEAVLARRLSQLMDLIIDHGPRSTEVRVFLKTHQQLPEFVSLAAVCILAYERAHAGDVSKADKPVVEEGNCKP